MPPPSDWRTWLVCAARLFGETRTGAEWVRHVAHSNPQARISLVAISLSEERAVLVDGESGIMAVHRHGKCPPFKSSLRRIVWPIGAQAVLYSAGEPGAFAGHSMAMLVAQAQKRVYDQRGYGAD